MEQTELTDTITEHPDWTLGQLAEHFGVTYQAVQSSFQTMRRRGIDYGYTNKPCSQSQGQSCGRRHPVRAPCEGCGWLSKEQRFWARVNFEGECWLWEGSTRAGYGSLSSTYAHHEAYRYTYGSIPDGLYVLHTCSAKLCVNPTHLRAGTQAENVNGNPTKGLKPRRRKSDPLGTLEVP